MSLLVLHFIQRQYVWCLSYLILLLYWLLHVGIDHSIALFYRILFCKYKTIIFLFIGLWVVFSLGLLGIMLVYKLGTCFVLVTQLTHFCRPYMWSIVVGWQLYLSALWDNAREVWKMFVSVSTSNSSMRYFWLFTPLSTLLILFHFHFRLLSCLWRYQVVLLIAFFDYYKIWTYFTYLLDIWQHRFEILVSLFCPFLILSFWFIVLYISWHDFFPGTLMLFLSLCTCVCVCVSLCVDEKF